MKSLSIVCLPALLVASLAQAERRPPARPIKPTLPKSTCYQLSLDGKTWSRTPERLCITGGARHAEIRLESGMPTAKQVAVFHLDLTRRAKCLDCNQDRYALANPSNSVFNALEIVFDGKRDLRAGTEHGKVSIGKTTFHYRKRR